MPFLPTKSEVKRQMRMAEKEQKEVEECLACKAFVSASGDAPVHLNPPKGLETPV